MTKNRKKHLNAVATRHRQGFWKTYRKTDNPILAEEKHGMLWRVLLPIRK